MNDELFPAESVAMDSPKLAWMKRHKVQTQHMPIHDGTETSPETGDILYPWVAWIERIHCELPGLMNAASAQTEYEAIATLAQKHGLKLWNEEAGA